MVLSPTALLGLNERVMTVSIALLYDREIAGEDQRARACYHELLLQFAKQGYLPNRLGIQSMKTLPPAAFDSAAFTKQLKTTLDPNDILAPHRYEFRDEWKE